MTKRKKVSQDATHSTIESVMNAMPDALEFATLMTLVQNAISQPDYCDCISCRNNHALAMRAVNKLCAVMEPKLQSAGLIITVNDDDNRESEDTFDDAYRFHPGPTTIQ